MFHNLLNGPLQYFEVWSTKQLISNWSTVSAEKLEKEASNKVPYRTYDHILQVTKVLSGKSLEILQCNRFI